MGSAVAMDPIPAPEKLNGPNRGKISGMKTKNKGKAKLSSSAKNKNIDNEMEVNESVAIDQKEKKRSEPETIVESVCSRKMPKRAAACSNFKEKSFHLSEKSSIIENKKERMVEEEISAVRLTPGPDDPRSCRRLTDFIFHNIDGHPLPVEMLEVEDMFISGFILPWDDSSEKAKEKGFKCEGFGRIESWAISGYEEGIPTIWISTEVADYDCVKPAASYRNFYDHFFDKARVCIEIFKKLSKSFGGSPDLSLDELLAGVVRSMSGSRGFPGGMSAREFLISQGEFVYNQLIGLDETSATTDQVFSGLPALVALRDECRKRGEFVMPMDVSSSGSLNIKDGGEELARSHQSSGAVEEDEDVKLARLLQEEEYWKSMKQQRNPRQKRNQRSASSSKDYYIKINEKEIANDYPLPAYYKTTLQEVDEYLVIESDDSMFIPRNFSKNVLHDWSLYNSDSRLISLELLPLNSDAETDLTIFGSGIMNEIEDGGFCSDADLIQSSSSASGDQHIDGVPIYLSSIKEWVIEFGSSMIITSIRTDMSWYILGRPSKQYAPWYEPVLKTSRLAISIIALLEEQARICRLTFADVIKKVAEFEKDHTAYISSNLALVERYVVVHGQIILRLFSVYPNENIKKCAFITGLSEKMEERHHTKLVVRKGLHKIKCEVNLNPRAALEPVISKRKTMQATTTRLINRIWGDYYSNYSPEDPERRDNTEVKEDEDDEQEENEDVEVEEKVLLQESIAPSTPQTVKSKGNHQGTRWEGEAVGKTSSGESLYKCALVHGEKLSVGGAVIVEVDDDEEMQVIYLVEYMFERLDGKKMVHGVVMENGARTVLGNAANEREVFLTNKCTEFELGCVKQTVTVDIRLMPWGYQHRKDNAHADKNDRAQATERKSKGLPMNYYCKSLYWPEKGAFFSLPTDSMGLGTGACCSCKIKKTEMKKEVFEVNSSRTSFVYKGINYSVGDFVYVSAYLFEANIEEQETFKSGRNVGLKAYAVCCLLDIEVPKVPKQADPGSTCVKVRRFFRPEDISSEKAYTSDIREVYYSEEIHSVPVDKMEGKCEIRKRHDLPSLDGPGILEHTFFCEHLYDPVKGTINQLPASSKLKFATWKDAASRKKKGKCKEGESESEFTEENNASQKARLATLDIFAGCGGLSEGLQKSGVSFTKWAIEYEEPAGEAFVRNHPNAMMFVDNCNVILRAIMEKCGDIDECISTPEAAELAAKLSEEKVNNLPLPGQVDFINGGPPCQGFSGMNRFNQSSWSKVQCEMILAFLSFAEYFRPRFFLLENVRNFVSFNKGQTFRLTLASLLEMGYQVRFGILEAGAFGVSQSRKRAFIWAASPHETLPEWPEPMHVFASPQLKISLPGGVQYAAACSTAGGAPFRAITVRDTIGDLPPVENGASKIEMTYSMEPTSWFQKQIRGNAMVLSDHISKEMNELNLIRCQRIPKRPGADWRDLPDEKVTLSNGQVEDLIPWCLPNTAKRHNQWKGLFGRLDWDGNFPTSITDPQPMGKVGMCFHPDQDRILTVRECARSQGFRDSYHFSGNIQSKHRQIGNAVPPPLAFALGWKLKEAVDGKSSAC